MADTTPAPDEPQPDPLGPGDDPQPGEPQPDEGDEAK